MATLSVLCTYSDSVKILSVARGTDPSHQFPEAAGAPLKPGGLRSTVISRKWLCHSGSHCSQEPVPDDARP